MKLSLSVIFPLANSESEGISKYLPIDSACSLDEKIPFR